MAANDGSPRTTEDFCERDRLSNHMRECYVEDGHSSSCEKVSTTCSLGREGEVKWAQIMMMHKDKQTVMMRMLARVHRLQSESKTYSRDLKHRSADKKSLSDGFCRDEAQRGKRLRGDPNGCISVSVRKDGCEEIKFQEAVDPSPTGSPHNGGLETSHIAACCCLRKADGACGDKTASETNSLRHPKFGKWEWEKVFSDSPTEPPKTDLTSSSSREERLEGLAGSPRGKPQNARSDFHDLNADSLTFKKDVHKQECSQNCSACEVSTSTQQSKGHMTSPKSPAAGNRRRTLKEDQRSETDLELRGCQIVGEGAHTLAGQVPIHLVTGEDGENEHGKTPKDTAFVSHASMTEQNDVAQGASGTKPQYQGLCTQHKEENVSMIFTEKPNNMCETIENCLHENPNNPAWSNLWKGRKRYPSSQGQGAQMSGGTQARNHEIDPIDSNKQHEEDVQVNTGDQVVEQPCTTENSNLDLHDDQNDENPDGAADGLKELESLPQCFSMSNDASHQSEHRAILLQQEWSLQNRSPENGCESPSSKGSNDQRGMSPNTIKSIHSQGASKIKQATINTISTPALTEKGKSSKVLLKRSKPGESFSECPAVARSPSQVSVEFAHQGICSNISKASETPAINVHTADIVNNPLNLVLELDHILINTCKFSELGKPDSVRLEQLLMCQNEKESTSRDLFKLHHLKTWIKLRPSLHNFLSEAAKRFTLWIHTRRNKSFTDAIMEIIDTSREIAANRIIYQQRSESVKSLCKSLAGSESTIIIVDDFAATWNENNTKNVIGVQQYLYFPMVRNKHHLRRKCLLEVQKDELSDRGMLMLTLTNILKLHAQFTSMVNGPRGRLETSLKDTKSGTLQVQAPNEDCPWDIRQVIRAVQQKVLHGMVLVFTHLVPSNQNIEGHPLWKLGLQFGAKCHLHCNSDTTHVVATVPGTAKVAWAVQNKRYVVTPNWLECSCALWCRANEERFHLGHGSF